MLEKGHISAGHARAVLSLGSPDAQFEFLRHCIQDKLSVRDAEYAATFWKEKGFFPWLNGEDETSSGMQKQGPDAQAAALESQELKRKTKTLFLQTVQKQLRQDLKIRASLSGSEARGRISLSYQSQEEFYILLRRLGIDVPDTIGE
jgi:ParB family chromosome partitioning protein